MLFQLVIFQIKINSVVLAEVELPTGQKYQFKYNFYGEIDKVIYPSGGYERFKYAAVSGIDPLNQPYTQANRGGVKRWISANGTGNDEQLWQSANSYLANNGYKATTAPDGRNSDATNQMTQGSCPQTQCNLTVDTNNNRLRQGKVTLMICQAI